MIDTSAPVSTGSEMTTPSTFTSIAFVGGTGELRQFDDAAVLASRTALTSFFSGGAPETRSTEVANATSGDCVHKKKYSLLGCLVEHS